MGHSTKADMTSSSAPPPSETELRLAPAKREPLWQDLLLVALACLSLALVVLFAPAQGALSVVRLVVAVLFVFLVPGYCLAAMLFPHADDLDMLERAGLSLGLSVALLPVLALVLDQLGVGLRLESFLWGEIFLCALLCALVLLQRLLLPPGQAFAPQLGRGISSQWHGMDAGGRMDGEDSTDICGAGWLGDRLGGAHLTDQPHHQRVLHAWFGWAGTGLSPPGGGWSADRVDRWYYQPGARCTNLPGGDLQSG